MLLAAFRNSRPSFTEESRSSESAFTTSFGLELLLKISQSSVSSQQDNNSDFTEQVKSTGKRQNLVSISKKRMVTCMPHTGHSTSTLLPHLFELAWLVTFAWQAVSHYKPLAPTPIV